MKDLKCLLVLALLSLSILPVCADVVQISGEIDRKAYLPQKLQFQGSEKIHAWLTSNQYCFRYISTGNGSISEYNYDGNVFITTHFMADLNSDGTIVSDALSNPDYSPKSPAFPAMITVSTNNIPDNRTSPEVYLWLAFYGRSYLATNRNLIPPVWVFEPREQKDWSFKLPAISENLQNDDYRIYFLNNGYTNLIFATESVTNICNVPIFLNSSFKNYAVDGNSKELYLRLLSEIKVSSIKVTKGDFDTNRFFPGEAQVHDQRFPVVEESLSSNSYFTNAFLYFTSNSGILYGNELTNSYQARLEEVKDISAEMKRQRNK
jgi:hypothetical protein